MTDTFKEIGSLFGREGAGAGFAKQTDKESFTYAFAWPEGDTCTSGRNALAADAPAMDAPGKDDQNIG